MQFMLMTPISYKLLRDMAMGYEYKTDTDKNNLLRNATTRDLHLVGKINHKIVTIPQWLLPNVKIDIKLELTQSSFILGNVAGTGPDVTVFLISAIFNA